MATLKLPKLPDRKPVRITIKIDPDLYRSLERYAQLYNAAYGQDERVGVLIPYILESFLVSDRAFAKATKAKSDDKSELDVEPASRRRNGVSQPSSAPEGPR